jgi:heat shock protein HslJ
MAGLRPPSLLATAVAVGVTTIGAGCGWSDVVDSRTATAGLPTTLQDLEAHEWLLDPADSSLGGTVEAAVTIVFDDDVVTGRGPCNSYHGAFDLDGDEGIEIGPLASTLRACPTPVMQAEDDYLAALEAVDTVDMEDDGDRLVLHDDDHVRLTFPARDPDD